MKKLLLLSFCFVKISLFAQSPNFNWVRGIGSTADDSGFSITVDSSGNVYTTGSFRRTVDFDPLSGVYNLISVNGSLDVFVCKMNPSGNLIWAKPMGGIGSEEGYSIKVDQAGNVYITGRFSSTVDFDPGPGVYNLTSNGGHDIFIAKLDPQGNLLWAKNIGGNGEDSGRSICIDGAGYVYTTGDFKNTVDFDPNAGLFNITAVSSNSDIFICKLDSSGNFVWAKSFEGQGYHYSEGMAIDKGCIYTTGDFQYTVDFDPGVGVYNLTAANTTTDNFISKIDTAGNFIWAKSFGGKFQDVSSSIDIDTAGNVYTTGYFQDTVDFDPNIGVYNLMALGRDIFVSKLNSQGSFVWAKSMEANGTYNEGYALKTDKSANVYITGYFGGVVDFDPGPGVYNLTAPNINDYDIFISELDSAGKFIWAKSMGGILTDYGNSIVLDPWNNIYTTGTFRKTVDFDPGQDTFNLTTPSPVQDIFIHKMGMCVPVIYSQNITVCQGDSIIIGGNVYHVAGKYYDAFSRMTGCDSIVITDLSIDSVNLGIVMNGETLSATQSGATYQWVNCNGNIPIAGATNQSYTAIANGSYAVIVTIGNCMDTSACKTVAGIGISENGSEQNVIIYPNPTTGQFIIELPEQSQVIISNYLGQTVLDEKPGKGRQAVDLSNRPTGIYLVRVMGENFHHVQKVIKQ